METGAKTKRPEREKTGQSLRSERARTDQALAERQATVESDADGVVQKARDTADAVLSQARERADGRMAPRRPDADTRAAIAQERRLEDFALRKERAEADWSLQQQRDESAAVLARLLPLERSTTDRYLLTERVRSDDAVSHRDDFLGIVSHDLRNLLAGIVLSASQMAGSAEREKPKELLVKGAQRIKRYVARMNRLLGDLLDVGSIDAGKLSIAPVRADAAALVFEAAEIFHPAAEEKGISLVVEPITVPLEASFDHDRMLQVLANLLSNAIKFTDRGGAIRLAGIVTGGRARIEVSDNGVGIPEDELEAVFERFWQAGKNEPPRRGPRPLHLAMHCRGAWWNHPGPKPAGRGQPLHGRAARRDLKRNEPQSQISRGWPASDRTGASWRGPAPANSLARGHGLSGSP